MLFLETNNGRDCLNFYMLHGNMHAIFFYKTWQFQGAWKPHFLPIGFFYIVRYFHNHPDTANER